MGKQESLLGSNLLFSLKKLTTQAILIAEE